ncbi:VolA/Pla-1 family phospholipase [Vibrio rumoiensis]|uniref:VolA/Pla-1 family phospholipase n=1 Tax=Vibrio rumoiensis TaxID=76258 RepID=A0ABW7ITS2_9VIBR
MNKYFKLTALCSAMLLVTACGDEKSSTGTDSSNQFESYINDSLAQSTKVDFTLQGKDQNVPLPTFILMNKVDGTLEIPTGGDDALSNPKAALSQMDGWSTSQPISIPFKGVGFNSAVLNSGVAIIELTDSLTGSPKVKAVLTQGTDFQIVTQANSVNIIPTKPLDEKSNYIIALTNQITDKDGDPVGMSSSYAALKTNTNTFETGDLSSLQQVIKGVEGIFSQAGIDPKSIVYSTWFTTQSIGDTLYATKAAVAQGLASKLAGGDGIGAIWKGEANPNDVDLSSAYTMSIASSGDFAAMLDADENFTTYIGGENSDALKVALNSQTSAAAVTVSKGIVNLPYFLEKGDNWNKTPFESGMPSLAIIKHALEGADASNIMQQLVEKGIDPSKLSDSSEQLKLIGLKLKDAAGNALDSQRIITQYSPVPKIKSLEKVPFILFTPKGASIGSTPIVVYQHGITSAKENAYAFAANMVASGISVIAIDQPLHGERSLDGTRSANIDPTAYINLSYLPVARDNVRESILDIIGLRAALSVTAKTLQAEPSLAASPAFAEFAKVNFTQLPRFFGHSLGGIVGVSAVAAANETLGNANADQLFAFSSGAFANAGSQIAPLLINSQTFGPSIVSNVGAENIAAFSFAAQTILDTVDPVNTASYIDPALPVYVSEVDGDKVVPNKVANTFAGTEPLALALGLTPTNASNTVVDGARNWVQFNSGASHSTVIAPASDYSDITQHTEMQTELIDFLTDNALSGVSDATTLK